MGHFSFASKKWLRTFGVFVCLFLFNSRGEAQTFCPSNLDFEAGTIALWECFTGVCCPISTPVATPPVFNRHTITSGLGTDKYGGFPTVAPGGAFSLRLGNDLIGAQAEKVRYYVHVPPSSARFILVYRYAVVFEDPGHPPADQPRFEVNLYDSATGVSLPCGYVSYVSSSGLPGFSKSALIGTGGAPVYYRTWDSASVNLTKYAGSTIIMDFASGDCAATGHFGYAYLDANCLPSLGSIAYCDTVTPITLSAPPGFSTYTWFDSATFTTIYGTGTPLTLPNPGTYTSYAVIMAPYSGLGCTDTLYVTAKPSALSLHPSRDTAMCVGGSIILRSGAVDIVSPLSYSWAPTAGLGCATCAITSATPAVTTTYTVTVTNPYGCVKDTTIKITVGPAPVAVITGPTTLCIGTTVALSGASAGGTWGISGAAATMTTPGVVTAVTPGTSVISYTVTNSCGAAVASRTITVVALPDAGTVSGGPEVCETDSIVMTSTLPGGVWSCTPNASITSSGVLTGLIAGTSMVSYVYTNFCGTAIDTAIVTINSMPSAGTISGPSRACVGFSITLLSSVSGGVWSSSNAAIAPVSVSGIVSAVAAGVVNISYSVSNAYCTNHAIKTVTVYPQADPGIITGFSALCEGATITLSTSQPGGVWTTSNALVSVSTTGVVSGLASGTAIVSYTVTNICGPQFVTKAVMVNPLPDIGNITGPHVVCVGASITLGGVSTDGTGTWVSSNKGVASVNARGVVLALSRGTSVITYTLTTVPGCKATAVHHVAVSPLPEPGSISGPLQLCTPMDMSFHQTRLGGVWSSSNTAVVSIDSLTGKASAVGIGAVTITYTIAADGLGCVASAIFPVAILAEAPFTIIETLANISCNGKADGSISVGTTGGDGPWQYVWADGNTGNVIAKLPPGPYSVQVADMSSGCKASRSYRISEPDSITAVPEVTDELCALANGAVSVIAKGGTPPFSFQWFDNSTGSRVAALPAGTYTVTIADINNCLKPLSAEVKDGGCNDITVSEGLSPNGDGANDLWYIKGISVYTNNLVQLFDKWGDKVFEQRGYNNKWDGRGTNGSMLPDGTYFYVVKLNAQNGAGGKDVLTGSLLIKR